MGRLYIEAGCAGIKCSDLQLSFEFSAVLRVTVMFRVLALECFPRWREHSTNLPSSVAFGDQSMRGWS